MRGGHAACRVKADRERGAVPHFECDRCFETRPAEAFTVLNGKRWRTCRFCYTTASTTRKLIEEFGPSLSTPETRGRIEDLRIARELGLDVEDEL